jgi:Type I phosphodiesterase / nucleotide pyrophosphatase
MMPTPIERSTWAASALATIAAIAGAGTVVAAPHNLVLFVPDGLRSQIVNAATAPAMARLRDEGVEFRNSHALYPTFTTANASAFATGHGIGDTGDFSNTLYTGVPIQGTVTPFLENDVVLRALNGQLGGNYLNEPSILANAAAGAGPNGLSVAIVGKLGPVAILDPVVFQNAGTLVLDDSTGQSGKDVSIPEDWRQLIESSKIRPVNAPARGDNANPGTFIANFAQQQYFLEMTLKVVLPRFKAVGRPFVLVYWSRDPDGSQHGQGDGSINGPTSMTAIRTADAALAAIEQTLKALGLYDTTNIIVAADHGFSTIAKDSEQGARTLPAGFLALDVAAALRSTDPQIRLFDPDDENKLLDAAGSHPSKGNGLIGTDPRAPQVVVTAGGGTDLIYLPVFGPEGLLANQDKVSRREERRVQRLGAQIVQALLDKDYVSGIFVDDARLGKLAGTLTLRDIGLAGTAKTLRPAIVVNFRSYLDKSCDQSERLLCAVEISDTPLSAGGGMHGSFSRADTWNFMVARGPDFREHYRDDLPASNADIGATVERLLDLHLQGNGKITGRVLSEALRDQVLAESQPVASKLVESAPDAKHGLKTVLREQVLGAHSYYDAAGFGGRTVGLN